MKTWEELLKEYPECRSEMSEERERAFVNECFKLYEAEGFAKVFWSPYEDETKYLGKKFKVIGRSPEDRNALCVQPMWDIEFEDGALYTVYPEEIIPSEMKANGCPKEYII